MRHTVFNSAISKLFFICFLCGLAVTGCGATKVQPTTAPKASTASPQVNPMVHQSWTHLLARLQKDVPNTDFSPFFVGLEEYSSAPMSTKVKELYTNAFIRRPTTPPSTNGTAVVRTSLFKGFVTTANVEKCKTYLQENKNAFTLMEQRYNVPKETVVALLFVETKLGTFLGNQKSFWSLACMAAATDPQKVEDGITDLAMAGKETWLQSKLTEKSNWAYNELIALLSHCTVNSLDPQGMPGSVYGAIGICQFMPSNLGPYGDDGNGDGKIDLFTEADAIVSVGKYLSSHGWKGQLTVAQQRKVIKLYNNHTRYANTILALAESIKTGKILTGPPDAPAKKAAAKKTVKGSKGTKKDTKKGKSTPKKVSQKQPAKKVTPLVLENPKP